MREDNAILPSAAAAQYLGLKPKTLLNWRHKGCGPHFIKFGGTFGRVGYRLSDLDEYVMARRRGGGTEPVESPAPQPHTARRQRTQRSRRGNQL